MTDTELAETIAKWQRAHALCRYDNYSIDTRELVPLLVAAEAGMNQGSIKRCLILTNGLLTLRPGGDFSDNIIWDVTAPHCPQALRDAFAAHGPNPVETKHDH